MNDKQKPKEYDLVLGGSNPLPVDGAVLGGIEGVEHRLASNETEVRIAAVKDALNYQDEGLSLVINALKDKSGKVQRVAHLLLKNRIEAEVQEALKKYQFWNLGERLQEKHGYSYITRFANKKVEEFKPEIGISDPLKTAYIIDAHNFSALLEDPQINQLEALILRWGEVNLVVDAKDKLISLKALHTGPCNTDYMISWLGKTNITPILKAYPQLKLLQVKGYVNIESFLSHNLQVLIIESSGLSNEAIAKISSSKLLKLRHLELWLGRAEYGGNSSIEDLKPILHYELFPKLTYLGLCNSEYSDTIAREIVKSPELNFIKILDLSLGTLTDEGARALLKCPEIKQLRFLNISDNYLSEKMLNKLKELPIYVVAERQELDNESYRYCSVGE